jgi:protein associated with RNAse G/E
LKQLENTQDVTERGLLTVCVRKYDGAEHRRWQANVLEQQGSLIILDGAFSEEVDHDLLGRIARGTRSIEYYWLDRWYNIFRFSEDSGELKSFYCNINMPPVLAPGVLTYVDLDIDVLVEPDFSYQVIDLDEFQVNAARFGYPAEVQKRAHESLAELISLIEARQFPFAEDILSPSVPSVVNSSS